MLDFGLIVELMSFACIIQQYGMLACLNKSRSSLLTNQQTNQPNIQPSLCSFILSIHTLDQSHSSYFLSLEITDLFHFISIQLHQMQHISLNSLAHCDYLIAWANDNACQAAIVQLYMDLFNLTQNKRSFEFDIWKLFFFIYV